jgi:hypothetical protein
MSEVVELWRTSGVQLVDAAIAVETRMRQDYAEMLGILSELDSRGEAVKLGYSNTAALLMHTLRISRAEARQRLTQAEQLHDVTTPTGAVIEAAMPLTAQELAKGAIGAGHVEVIQKTLGTMKHLDREQVAWAEQLMIERAAEDEPAALARYGNRWVRDIVDPDGTPPVDDEPRRAERELRRQVFRDGHMEFTGRLDPETAAKFDALLAPFDKRQSDDTRSPVERSGDAFADILQLAANCPDLPTHNGLKTEIALTITLDALQRTLDEVVLPGTSLTAGEARRLACDAHVLPVVMDGESKPLDVAAPSYVVPAHIRRALVLRDKGCSFPAVRHEALSTNSEVRDRRYCYVAP